MCLTIGSTIRRICPREENIVELSSFSKRAAHKVDITWAVQKLATLKQFVRPMTFCSLRPRKRNTKVPDNVCLLREHILWIVRTLGRQHTIKIAKGLFLEIRVFFYSKLL